ncbi:hypothetical protein Fmac_001703 [Flemingia macrophylla]|uniref:Uncharacterized protein n=1 Tax=Flemingia macrophylla TaxID=520843 RepID=A0ABD1NJI9_9FABA
MADILISVVAKIAKYMTDPILHHAQYICYFNNFAENFLNAKRELESTQKVVKERVDIAINRAEKIEPTVNEWLTVVKNVLIKVQNPRRILEINKSCFRRQCKYFLARKIAREIEKMIQLKREGNFKSVSIITEYTCVKYYSSKGFVLFKSTTSTYYDLLEVLEDNNAYMIGLVGMRGSGKITLAKEVGKKVKELKIFENVIIATVSKTPNIISIQAQIADKLGLKLEEESNECRAQRLSQRLMMETTLLILDDVWEKLDFEALGIPLKENDKGCQVLLTTHDREVCASMQCQSVNLDILTNEEAWILSKSHAEIIDESSNALNDVGKKVVDKCKGLPIAIVMIGNTLKGKTIEEWKLTLSRLEGLSSPNGCFQVSYENLTNKLAKSLFLMCSMFPEDHEIDLEDLFRFGWGQGLLENVGTMEKARKGFHEFINILKDSFLLLHAKKEKVKMHDMVRDVALR